MPWDRGVLEDMQSLMLMNSPLVCPWSEEGSAGDIEGLFQVGKNGFPPGIVLTATVKAEENLKETLRFYRMHTHWVLSLLQFCPVIRQTPTSCVLSPTRRSSS